MSTPNLFVGIDVAKSKFDVCFLDTDESSVRPNATYSNDPHGWAKLLDTLHGLRDSEEYLAHCAMESTGVYHESLCRYLCTQERVPTLVSVLNPFGVKNFGKAMLKDTKTDNIDARLIGQYTNRMKPRPVVQLTDEQRALKEITRSRRRLIEDRNREVNRMYTLLHRHYPGYQTVLGKTLSVSLLAIMSEIQSPRAITDHSLSELVAIRLGPRHHVHAAIAGKLQELAKQVPVQQLHKSTELLIGMRARRIRELDAQIKIVEKSIAALIEEMPQGRLLMTIPGLGPVTAAVVLAEVGDIRRFATKESFVGYCGLYPIVWESGEVKRKYKMSRKGNRWLKTALLVVTGPARIHNPTLALYNRRMQASGKPTKAIGGALARKLAHIIWAVMTNDTPWSPNKAQRGHDKAESMLDSAPN